MSFIETRKRLAIPKRTIKEIPTTLTKPQFTFLSANLTMDKDLATGNIFNLKAKSYDNFFTIAKMMVPMGTAIAFGTRGGKRLINCRVDEASGEIIGRFKVIGAHPSGYPMVDLGTFSTRNMDSTATADKTKNPTPEIVEKWILEAGYILVSFQPEVDDKVLVYNDTDNRLVIPVTKRYGMKRPL